MKILALKEIPSLGLFLGWQYNTQDGVISEEIAKIYVQFGFATEITSDNYPKGIDTYEEKVYKKGMFVFKDNSAYKANIDTSATWIYGEWDLILKGA